jgi:hypothetical protein
VLRCDIDKVHLITLSREVAGVTAGPAAHIQNSSGCGRKESFEKLTCAVSLQFAAIGVEPVLFIAG